MVQRSREPVTVKDVWISIKGAGSKRDPDEDIELITEGKLFIDNGKYLIEYDESQMTGMFGTKTSMAIEGDNVTVVRQGKINSNFMFTKGMRQDSMYETEDGSFKVSIFTSNVDIEFGDNGGMVKVEYQVDFMNDLGKNYIHMFVREVKH